VLGRLLLNGLGWLGGCIVESRNNLTDLTSLVDQATALYPAKFSVGLREKVNDMPTGCVKSVATRILGWKLRVLKADLKLLQAEKAQSKTEKETREWAEQIYAKLDEIRRVERELFKAVGKVWME